MKRVGTQILLNLRTCNLMSSSASALVGKQGWLDVSEGFASRQTQTPATLWLWSQLRCVFLQCWCAHIFPTSTHPSCILGIYISYSHFLTPRRMISLRGRRQCFCLFVCPFTFACNIWKVKSTVREEFCATGNAFFLSCCDSNIKWPHIVAFVTSCVNAYIVPCSLHLSNPSV